MKLGIFHYQLLYQILERIHYIYDETQLADEVLENISAALDAEAATIFKLQPDGRLFPLSAFGVSLTKLRQLSFETGKGVVGWVVQYGQPVKVDRPDTDPRFLNQIDSVTGFKTSSILAAPILAKGKVIGVIEFLNRRNGVFQFPDLELVGMVGREVGIAFENVSLVKELSHTRAFLDAVTNSLSAGIIVVDGGQRLLKVNPKAVQILAMTGDQTDWIGKKIADVLNDYPELVVIINSLVSASTPVQRQEVVLSIKGEKRIIGYSGVFVATPQKQRLGTALLFQDITAYAKKS
jgi:PAS domain S-box-containing protein